MGANTQSDAAQERDQNIRGPVAHCCACATADTEAYRRSQDLQAESDRRSQMLQAATEIAQFDEQKIPQDLVPLRESAIKVLRKLFDAELMPKGF